jgi:hypothetical protein
VRDGESRFSGTAQSPARHLRSRLGLLGALTASIALLAAPSAFAAYVHPAPSYEFGPTGLPTTAFPGSSSVGEMDFDQSSKRLFVLNKSSDNKVYALHFAGAGSYGAVGSPYPLSVASTGCCTDIAIDNTAGSTAENLYYSPDGEPIFGYTSAGAPLPAFAPEGGEKCGVGVDNEGHLWTGNFGTRKIEEFNPTGGAPIKTVDVSGTGLPCRVRFDLSNNDMYVSQYSGEGAIRYTAASGYSAASAKIIDPTRDTKIAINATRHVVYIAGTSQVSAYDTASGSLLETFGEEAGCSINGIAVDDATDTVFLSRPCTNEVQEWKGTVVPDAITGDPTGNSTVSGSVALAGGGEVTSCEFQFGLTTSYGQSRPCNPAAPYSADQALVTANLKEDLTGETTYHYRLVASNADGTARGADKTITPHNVKNLTTGPASEITNTTARVSGTFEGNGEDTHYYFEYGRTTSYGRKTPIPPEDAGEPTGLTDIHAVLTELVPGATYHYRAVASNGLGTSRAGDQTFSTFQPPSIEGFSSSGVTASSADISAKINPNGFETDYYVEYGPTPAYGNSAPIPNALLPAGNATETVAVHLTGLENMVYHFRVAAHNTWGTTFTDDRTFTFFPPSCPNAVLRQKTGSSYLPDCRAYELVSPAIAGNIKLLPIGQPSPFAQNPSRFLYLGVDGVLDGTAGTNSYSADTYVATRTTSGWISKYTGIHSDQTPWNYFGMGSRDLDRFINFKSGCCAQIPYIFDNEEDFIGRWPSNFEEIPGTEAGPNDVLGTFQPSPDFSHMAFSSKLQFDPEGQGLTSAPGSAYDYDVATETTELISKTAAGGNIPQDPNNPDPNEVIDFPGSLGSGIPRQMNPSLSIDGSHILMSTKGCTGCTTEHLYMRVGGGHGVTYDIAGGAAVDYYGLTSDAKKVFFTSNLQLTADDHDTSVDLYMWSEQGQLEGKPLTRISAGSAGKGDTDACSTSWTEKCNVEAVRGIGQETDYPIAVDSGDVYFYSPELLDPAESGVDGGRNLYVYRDGQVHFVTSLNPDGSDAVTRIQVSPDGSHAAFVTASKLTSYENAGYEEMYSFDPSTGAVECVSCIPTGEPPTANVRASLGGFFMTDDGRPFFSTTDALVPKDTNEGSDVYEFVEGRPQLISTGTGQAYHRASGEIIPLSLMGVSPNGVDAYFSTFDTLVPQDLNGAFVKFYDARAGGGFEFLRPSPPCEAADECHGAGSAPPAPAVITSDGKLGPGGNASKTSAPKRHSKRKSHRHKRKRKAHGSRAHRRVSRG